MFSALQRQTCKEVHEMLIEINEGCKNCKENAYSNFMLKTGLHLSLLCTILNMKGKDKIGNTLQAAMSRYAV